MSRRRADHVVVDASANPPVARCLRCGETQALPFPMRVDILVAIEKVMTKAHRDCRERPAVEENRR